MHRGEDGGENELPVECRCVARRRCLLLPLSLGRPRHVVAALPGLLSNIDEPLQEECPHFQRCAVRSRAIRVVVILRARQSDDGVDLVRETGSDHIKRLAQDTRANLRCIGMFKDGAEDVKG